MLPQLTHLSCFRKNDFRGTVGREGTTLFRAPYLQA